MIFISGCFSDSNDNSSINYATKNDLELIISMDQDIFSINSSAIILNVAIKNIAKKSVFIGEYYKSEDTGIFFISQNKTLIPQMSSPDYEKEEPIEIKEYSNISYSYNLLNYTPLFDKTNGEKFDFPQCGNYNIYVIFELKGNDYISSNRVQFKVA